jgi:putative phage-type endonuclease
LTAVLKERPTLPDRPKTLPPVAPMLPFDVVCDSREREAWLRARRATIGASEAAIVLGCSPWSSQLELWAEKTGRTQGNPELDSAEYVFWGRELEDAIIAGYGKRAERTAVPFGLLLVSTRWPWLSATPDALVTDDPVAGARASAITRTLGQIRTVLKKKASTKNLLRTLHELTRGWWPLQTKNIGFGSAEHWAEGVPLYYRVQCLQEALVFGADKVTGAALIAGQRLAWDDLEVDREGLLERQVVNLTRLFMRERVELGVEPAVDGSESARKTLAALYPLEKPEKTIALGGELMEGADLYDRHKAEIKRLEDALALFGNQVRQEMQDAERCVFPNGSGFTCKANKSGSRVLLRKKAKGE